MMDSLKASTRVLRGGMMMGQRPTRGRGGAPWNGNEYPNIAGVTCCHAPTRSVSFPESPPQATDGHDAAGLSWPGSDHAKEQRFDPADLFVKLSERLAIPSKNA
jgi:hypothetical protein